MKKKISLLLLILCVIPFYSVNALTTSSLNYHFPYFDLNTDGKYVKNFAKVDSDYGEIALHRDKTGNSTELHNGDRYFQEVTDYKNRNMKLFVTNPIYRGRSAKLQDTYILYKNIIKIGDKFYTIRVDILEVNNQCVIAKEYPSFSSDAYLSGIGYINNRGEIRLKLSLEDRYGNPAYFDKLNFQLSDLDTYNRYSEAIEVEDFYATKYNTIIPTDGYVHDVKVYRGNIFYGVRDDNNIKRVVNLQGTNLTKGKPQTIWIGNPYGYIGGGVFTGVSFSAPAYGGLKIIKN